MRPVTLFGKVEIITGVALQKQTRVKNAIKNTCMNTLYWFFEWCTGYFENWGNILVFVPFFDFCISCTFFQGIRLYMNACYWFWMTCFKKRLLGTALEFFYFIIYYIILVITHWTYLLQGVHKKLMWRSWRHMGFFGVIFCSLSIGYIIVTSIII